MMDQLLLRIAVLYSLVIFSLNPGNASAASFAAQSNFNLGMDLPASDAGHSGTSYLARFQLGRAPSLFSPRASFTVDYGAGLLGGEFNLGLAIYPFSKLRDELRAQPFIGFEGDLFLGSRDSVVNFNPGGGLIAGVDIRVAGNFGLTLETDYIIFPGQKSARLWLGFNFYSPPSSN